MMDCRVEPGNGRKDGEHAAVHHCGARIHDAFRWSAIFLHRATGKAARKRNPDTTWDAIAERFDDLFAELARPIG
jgi:hypothetical protein